MASYAGRVTWLIIGLAIVALLALIMWGAINDTPAPDDVQSEAER